MPTIIITEEAEQALKSSSFRTNETWSGGEQLLDGTWVIKLSMETFERLHEAQLKGESYSDTILRLMQFHKSGGLQ